MSINGMNLPRPKVAVILLVVVITGWLSPGCNKSDSVTGESNLPSELPKFDFHKPETLDIAVSRLREINEAVVSDVPLPKPRKYEVLEIIHGSGASAHSHYYLAGAQREEHDEHEHEPMKEEEKTHQIEVDIFTEFYDIARWLPKIAAATDGVDEESFNTAAAVGKGLADLSGPILKSKQNDERRRSFRSNSELSALMKRLESVFDGAQ